MNPILVKNITIKEVNFKQRLREINQDKNKSLKNALSYIEFLNSGIDGESLLPERSKFEVDFDIHDTCSGFANGIRKCIIDEIPICSMTMDEEMFETNDRYILSDDLQKNIDLIPILQEIDIEKAKKWKISLDVLNSTDEVISVKSGDIEIYEGKKKIAVESIMSSNISIMDLHPAKFLRIKEIRIIQGFSKDDSAKFATVSNTRYEIQDMKPLAHNIEEKDSGTSSLTHDPTKFHIGYTTYRNVKDPKIIILKCCDTLGERLSAFSKELDNIQEDKKTKVISHFSTFLDVETKNDFKFFNFKNESWTLVNMISQYCFLLDKNIPFVAPAIIHPSTEIGVVKIKHRNPVKIIKDAIGSIQRDIEILKKAF